MDEHSSCSDPEPGGLGRYDVSLSILEIPESIHVGRNGVRPKRRLLRKPVRAGQTGGVTSPQVHFEIRKGSTPVDPTQYLAGL